MVMLFRKEFKDAVGS